MKTQGRREKHRQGNDRKEAEEYSQWSYENRQCGRRRSGSWKGDPYGPLNQETAAYMIHCVSSAHE